MNAELRYLIHYYTDETHLFTTIMMYSEQERDHICDAIVKNKNWFWERFRTYDRKFYLQRRTFVEQCMKNEFEHDYYPLQGNVPIYFYLVPGMNHAIAEEKCKSRTEYEEINTKYILLDVNRIQACQSVTFTLEDSFRSYWKKAREAGIKCFEDGRKRIELEDHNKTFPFSEIETLYRKYQATNTNYEVQIWDQAFIHELREDVKQTLSAGKITNRVMKES